MARKDVLGPARLTVSKSTLAAALEVSESTVEELVRRGVLPKPMRLSAGCVRWSWAAVEQALASLSGTDENTDPFMAGANNVSEAIKSDR